MASHTRLYVHLVWATWDRLPLIRPEHEQRIAAAIVAKSRSLGCSPIAIGLMPDHCHLLVRMDPMISISAMAKEVKGSTSHLMTHEIAPNEFFKWQGHYGAFSVGEADVPSVTEYVRSQKEHHEEGLCQSEWEVPQVSTGVATHR